MSMSEWEEVVDRPDQREPISHWRRVIYGIQVDLFCARAGRYQSSWRGECKQAGFAKSLGTGSADLEIWQCAAEAELARHIGSLAAMLTKLI